MGLLRDISRTIRRPFNLMTAKRLLEAFHERDRNVEEIVDLALNFKTTGFYRIRTIQIRSEILSLARAVEALKPKIILEIGTSQGGTLMIWSHLASQKVITCDLSPPGPRGDLYPLFSPGPSGPQVKTMLGDSHSLEFVRRVEEELGGERVDFLFIDGDHSDAGVTTDYENYRHLVRQGGIIAFHDIHDKVKVEAYEVYLLWKRLRARGDLILEEFIDDSGQLGFGIGIIRIP